MFLFIYSKLALEAFVIPIISVFGIVFVYTLILETLNFRLLDGIESNFLKAIIYVMALDFSGYVYHVLCHKIPFLWEIHKFHHSSTEMNLITGTRDHPVERTIKKIFEALPLAILGAPTEIFLSLAILQYSLGIFSHSDFNLHYGKIGYVLISPLAHRIHHSVLKEHWDRNYGSTFSLWDHIFGTAYKGKNFKPQIDVTDNYFNQRGFLYDLTMPVVKSVKVAIRGRNALAQPQRNPV
jgi:sterol desaturase/sphingolipid hydroxylase (fatty acid hydroxylase superfamily)